MQNEKFDYDDDIVDAEVVGDSDENDESRWQPSNWMVLCVVTLFGSHLLANTSDDAFSEFAWNATTCAGFIWFVLTLMCEARSYWKFHH